MSSRKRYDAAEPAAGPAGPGPGMPGPPVAPSPSRPRGPPLEVAVCHELSASGYRPVPPGSDAPVLVIASELAMPAGWLVSRYGRWRAARLSDQFVAVARLARERGAARLVARSSALLSGRPSRPGPGRRWLGDALPGLG